MLSLSRCGIAGGAADFDRGDPGFDAGLERGAGVPPSGAAALGPAVPSLAAVADGGAVAMLGGEGGRGEVRARWRPQIHVRGEGVVAGGLLRWSRRRRRRVEWGRGLEGDRGLGGDGGGCGFGNVEVRGFAETCAACPGAKAHGVQRYAMGQSRTGIVRNGLAVPHTSSAAHQWCLGAVPRTFWRLHSHRRPGWPDRVKRQWKGPGPSSRTPGANGGSSPP